MVWQLVRLRAVHFLRVVSHACAMLCAVMRKRMKQRQGDLHHSTRNAILVRQWQAVEELILSGQVSERWPGQGVYCSRACTTASYAPISSFVRFGARKSNAKRMLTTFSHASKAPPVCAIKCLNITPLCVHCALCRW